MLTCLIGMALPLPMLSVLLSTLFACSLPFRDCKRTRESVRNQEDTQETGQWWKLWGGCSFVCCGVGASVGEADRLGVRKVRGVCVYEHLRCSW